MGVGWGRGGTSMLRLAQLDENPLIAAAQGFNQRSALTGSVRGECDYECDGEDEAEDEGECQRNGEGEVRIWVEPTVRVRVRVRVLGW